MSTPQDPAAAETPEIPDGWTASADGTSIHRDLSFKDFKQAWAFMNEVAPVADAADHHPDWSNVYNRVSITLSSHDVGHLTSRDTDLAGRINEILAAQTT